MKDIGDDFWRQIPETEHAPVYERSVELELEGCAEKSKVDSGAESLNLSFTECYRLGPLFEPLSSCRVQLPGAGRDGFRHGCEAIFHDLQLKIRVTL